MNGLPLETLHWAFSNLKTPPIFSGLFGRFKKKAIMVPLSIIPAKLTKLVYLGVPLQL